MYAITAILLHYFSVTSWFLYFCCVLYTEKRVNQKGSPFITVKNFALYYILSQNSSKVIDLWQLKNVLYNSWKLFNCTVHVFTLKRILPHVYVTYLRFVLDCFQLHVHVPLLLYSSAISLFLIQLPLPEGSAHSG